MPYTSFNKVSWRPDDSIDFFDDLKNFYLIITLAADGESKSQQQHLFWHIRNTYPRESRHISEKIFCDLHSGQGYIVLLQIKMN
jgi:hypothetical protein